jgi:hypothetical protein
MLPVLSATHALLGCPWEEGDKREIECRSQGWSERHEEQEKKARRKEKDRAPWRNSGTLPWTPGLASCSRLAEQQQRSGRVVQAWSRRGPGKRPGCDEKTAANVDK